MLEEKSDVYGTVEATKVGVINAAVSAGFDLILVQN
jgi:hypothetical protein